MAILRYWPAFTTEHSRSTHNTWDEIGEALIRELDYSTVTLQLNTAEKDTREDVIAKVQVDMNQFLESSLDKPYTFTLMPTDGFGARSTVTIMSKYIPVSMQLLKRESITDTGMLRIDLLDGKGLPSADRNGKSDPYCVFSVDGERVHKSEVCKKTLAPVWNEKFETHIYSRERSELLLEVFDWDRVGRPPLYRVQRRQDPLTGFAPLVGTSDKLGRAIVDIDNGIEPFEAVEKTVSLARFDDTTKSAGEIRIRLVFTPQFMHRTRKATSTFSAGRIGTSLGGGVANVGGGVVHAGEFVGKTGVGAVSTVGKAGFHGVSSVGKGVFGVGRRLTGQQSRRTSYAPNDAVDFAAVPTGSGVSGTTPPGDENGYEVLAAAAGSHHGAAGFGATDTGTAGNLTVTLGELKSVGDQGEKKAILVKLNGGKTLFESHSHKDEPAVLGETFSVNTPAEGPADLTLQAVHKKAIGSDKVLASATFSVWQYVSPSAPSASVTIPLAGGYAGQLEVSLAVRSPAEAPLPLFSVRILTPLCTAVDSGPSLSLAVGLVLDARPGSEVYRWLDDGRITFDQAFAVLERALQSAQGVFACSRLSIASHLLPLPICAYTCPYTSTSTKTLL